MCILNYRGEGYSEEFTANMDEVVASLTEDTQIVLEKSADCLCRACHNREAVTQANPVGCKFMDKVARYDEGLLKMLELNEGSRISWCDLRRLVLGLILPKNIEGICGDCEWFGICEAACMDSAGG